MDSLFTLEQAYYTGRYQDAVECDLSDLEGKELSRGTELVARANIALGNFDKVIGSSDVVKALQLYAQFRKNRVQSQSEDSDNILSQIENEFKSYGDDDSVRYTTAKAMASVGKFSEALDTLSGHHSLDCASLQIQIYLMRNRLDLASAVVEETKPWAQDSIVFNLCEAWVLLAQHDADASQNAFYIYEELAAGSQSPSSQAIAGQALSQLMLGRVEEAIELLNEAVTVDEGNQEALSNLVAAATLDTQGQTHVDVSQYESRLEASCTAVQDVEAKSALFDQVASKYTISAAN